MRSVVDDDPLVRRSTQRMLGRLGYEVLAAPDGVTALDWAADWETKIDVLILLVEDDPPTPSSCGGRS